MQNQKTKYLFLAVAIITIAGSAGSHIPALFPTADAQWWCLWCDEPEDEWNATCGNGICDTGETNTCPGDCEFDLPPFSSSASSGDGGECRTDDDCPQPDSPIMCKEVGGLCLYTGYATSCIDGSCVMEEKSWGRCEGGCGGDDGACTSDGDCSAGECCDGNTGQCSAAACGGNECAAGSSCGSAIMCWFRGGRCVSGTCNQFEGCCCDLGGGQCQINNDCQVPECDPCEENAQGQCQRLCTGYPCVLNACVPTTRLINCAADACGDQCGNGSCDSGESIITCPQDCEIQQGCGDGACNGTETCDTCTADCECSDPVDCGDGMCLGDETCASCDQDCGDCPIEEVCGNGTCGDAETCNNCSADCGECVGEHCGDSTCDPNENCQQCPDDCGSCAEYCGDGYCNADETCDTCRGDCEATCKEQDECHGDSDCGDINGKCICLGNEACKCFTYCPCGGFALPGECADVCGNNGICGNGVVDLGEQCDDGNIVRGDGCDERCQNERVLAHETNCTDRIDNDWDGVIDCDDSDCANHSSCKPFEGFCGDGTCDGTETCASCEIDCGPCEEDPRCGDHACNGSETCRNCSADCGTCGGGEICGNDVCAASESCSSCTRDCGSCNEDDCNNKIDDDRDGLTDCADPDCKDDWMCFFIGGYCGDGSCSEEEDESCRSCPQDCGTCGGGMCGNGAMDADETCFSCPVDVACPTGSQCCGDGSCQGSCPDGGMCGNGFLEKGEECEKNVPCPQGQLCSICQCEGDPPPPFCGDAYCNGDESCGSCAQDCGTCSEEECRNEMDDDRDGPIDCADSDCKTWTNYWCWGSDPKCGDGACQAENSESCSTCAEDCGECGGGVCGDEMCDLTESCSDCPGDCGACGNNAFCGDGACTGAENCNTCPNDCNACAPACGNGTCEAGESCLSCGADCGECGAQCGDGACNGAESCENCAEDCECTIPSCGNAVCEADETCANCGVDCGPCFGDTCNDGMCTGAETCASCAPDCGECGGGNVCGDGSCSATENCGSCAMDCGSCGGDACGDDLCTGAETCDTCTADCGECENGPLPPYCGNTVCENTETCDSCAADCGACVAAVCGDAICNGQESCSTCAQDCGQCNAVERCGNGVCAPGETCDSCAWDCGSCNRADVCGDSRCTGIESCSACPGDCGQCVYAEPCGNAICRRFETCANCSRDCGACSDIVIKNTPLLRICTDLQCCGDSACQELDGETEENCRKDCRLKPAHRCGDKVCSNTKEDCASCSKDCGMCTPENPSRITRLRLRERGYFFCKENDVFIFCAQEEYCAECKGAGQLEGDCSICKDAPSMQVIRNAQRLTASLLTQAPSVIGDKLPPAVKKKLGDGFRSFQKTTEPYTDPVFSFIKSIPVGFWIIALIVVLTIMIPRWYRQKHLEKQW